MDTVRDNTGSRRIHRRNINRRATLILGMGGLVGAAAPTAASASQLPNLKAVGPHGQVTAICRYCDTFEVTTADGRRTVFQETNVRFKFDTSELGPLAGKPVILPGGKWGDRATVFFVSPAEISVLDH
jgi:hypothetical protein